MTPDKPKRGRPFTLPPDTRLRAMRLTDAEFNACKELVAKMRQRKPRNRT